MAVPTGNGRAEETYYNLGSFLDYGILVPTTVPVEAVVRMVAALTSFELDVRSIDRQLKVYREIWEPAAQSQYTAGPAKRSFLVDRLLGKNKKAFIEEKGGDALS